MIYNIELRIHLEGFGVTRFNRFRDQLDKNIHEWIREVRREYGYRDIEVEKVLVNGERIKAPYQE